VIGAMPEAGIPSSVNQTGGAAAIGGTELWTEIDGQKTKTTRSC